MKEGAYIQGGAYNRKEFSVTWCAPANWVPSGHANKCGTLYLVFDEVPSEQIDMAGPLLEYESAMFMEVMGDDGLFISAK